MMKPEARPQRRVIFPSYMKNQGNQRYSYGQPYERPSRDTSKTNSCDGSSADGRTRRKSGSSSNSQTLQDSYALSVATWTGNDTSEALSYGEDNNQADDTQEVEIVFAQDVVQKKPSLEDDMASASSEKVLTGASYWDNLVLAAALQELPTDAASSQAASVEEDELSGNSSSADEEDDSCASASTNDADNEWTDLTNPKVLETNVQENRSPETTILSEKLWERDYPTVEARILSHPKEVSTMIDLPASKEPVQGYPLHLACAMRPLPPLSIFQLLLSVYPEAALQAESQWGMLPLHFAANLSHYQGLEEDDHHVGLVEILLSANPEARTTQELCQGRTPLHLAASSTVQSMDGMIPSASYTILQLLTPNEALWTTDLAGDSAYEIAQSKSNQSLTTGTTNVVEMEMGWKLNPLLQLTPPHEDRDVFKPAKKLAEEEDNTSVTDATSVTGSLSSGSFTSGYTQQQLLLQQAEEKEEALAGVQEAENEDESAQDEDVVSVSDDDTFFTARSHEQSTVQMDNTKDTASQLDAASLLQLTAGVPEPPKVDQDEVESILTVEQDASAVVRSVSAAEELQTNQEATNPLVPYIPRAVQVDKVLLHLQVHVSDLVRLRKPTKSFIKSALPVKKSINPYFEVELLHRQTDVAVRLHQSQPYYQRREALWEPVRFAIDATIARSRGMVLSLNMYHKQVNKKDHKNKTKNKSKEDEWIGGYAASPWALRESIEQIPLMRDHVITGKVRLVSYHMVPMNKADCWRIYW